MNAPVYPSLSRQQTCSLPSTNLQREQHLPPIMTKAPSEPFPPTPPLFIHPSPNAPTLTDEQLNTKPRPHPHLPSLAVYIDHVPPEMTEEDIAKTIPDCTPVRIELWHHVPPNERIQPNMYYNWMPKMGSVTFQDERMAEKGMAILASHPMLTPRGVLVSPYPLPSLLPPSNTTGRYIQPLHQSIVPPAQPAQPTERIMIQCPSPSELFDGAREWGSIRELRVWAEIPPESEGETNTPVWGARIDFWFEDEAKRFEIGFGQRGGLIKGWQVAIYPEPIMSVPMPLMAPLPPLLSPQTPSSAGSPTPEHFNFFPGDLPPDPAYPLVAPDLMGSPFVNMGDMSKQPPYPAYPPTLCYTPPWAAHNPYTINGTDMPMQMGYPPLVSPGLMTPPYGQFPLPSPMSPTARGSFRGQRRLSRASMGSLRNQTPARPRTWSLTVRTGPTGNVQSGLVSNDGTVIQHGPGQHIGPAPPVGPGSTSSSGLVDYSNVFVKNLDADINSQFLADLFSISGSVVSARVMRDDKQLSRGYGFVSFHSPEQAAEAVQRFHGALVGTSNISVTLHEPRMLRNEKKGQETRRRPSDAPALGVSKGQDDTARSSSPVFGTLKSCRSIKEFYPVAATDKLRSLSADQRKCALESRVVAIVTSYFRYQDTAVSEDLKNSLAEALVREDLELIPLLYDASALKAKIEEIISTLRVEASGTQPPDQQDSEKPTVKRPVALKDTESIRLQIALIDPVDVDAVMPILLRGMTWGDVELCLSSRAAMAQRYSDAKKKLIKQRLETTTATAEAAPPVSEPVSPHPLPFDLDTLHFDELVSLPTRYIINALQSDTSEQVLKKIGLAQPSSSELFSISDWTRATMKKSGVERKTEMAGMLLRRLQGDMRRSQKIKVARNVVNLEEDDEALCLLMAWPILLNAKAHKVSEAA